MNKFPRWLNALTLLLATWVTFSFCDFVIAQGGGYPTRPRFDAVGIGVNAPTTNGQEVVLGTTPVNDMVESDASVNNGRWRRTLSAEQFIEQICNDAISTCNPWIQVDRTGTTVDSINLVAGALTFNGSPISGATFANPTGTVGLTTVNGVATTALRSDAAPPLSQAIAPTWTGAHVFSSVFAATQPQIKISAASPVHEWNETDAAANNRLWRMYPSGEMFVFDLANDADTSAVNIMTVDRTANTVDVISFADTSLEVANGTGGSFAVFEEGASGTLTGTGFSTSVTPSYACRTLNNNNGGTTRSKILYITIDTASGTSNATTFTLTGLAAACRPSTTFYQVVPAVNLGVDVLGVVQVGTGGTITVYNGVVNGAWANTGQKALQHITIVGPML